MRSVRFVLTALAIAGLLGCQPAADGVRDMSQLDLAQELRRCRDLGPKVYEDRRCRLAQDERNQRLLTGAPSVRP